MNTQNIKKTFGKIKAGITVEKPRNRSNGYSINVRKGEFIITQPSDAEAIAFDVQVIDFDQKDRHVLLNISHKETNKNRTTIINDKWLCGHDERDWFVGAIPKNNAITIPAAKEALKPKEVVEVETTVHRKTKNKRKNTARIRQGEWFFIPEPELKVAEYLIHKNEPISRGNGSKPHYIEEVYRMGGKGIYSDGEKILTLIEYDKLLPGQKLLFRPRFVGATVYARGDVKHADHATIHLSCWHKVLMNTENTASTRKFLTFLD